jgi:hypothetical protein
MCLALFTLYFFIAYLTASMHVAPVDVSHLPDTYASMKASVTQEKDYYGKPVQLAPIVYPANQSIDRRKLKQVRDLQGSFSDVELAEKGGYFTIKQIMTYRQYVNFGPSRGVRWDVDPDRLVWMIQARFPKSTDGNGNTVHNKVSTTLYDAQTGDMLEVGATNVSNPPHAISKH